MSHSVETPMPGQVVDALDQPGEVADAVAVPVEERLDVEAVDDPVLPPLVAGERRCSSAADTSRQDLARRTRR